MLLDQWKHYININGLDYYYIKGYPQQAFEVICKIYSNIINSELLGLTDRVDKWKNWEHLNNDLYLPRIITICAVHDNNIIGVLLSTATDNHERMLIKMSELEENKLRKTNGTIISISKIGVIESYQRQGISKNMVKILPDIWKMLSRNPTLIISNYKSREFHIKSGFVECSDLEANYRYIKYLVSENII